jgi:RHS repeat-associated protein
MKRYLYLVLLLAPLVLTAAGTNESEEHKPTLRIEEAMRLWQERWLVACGGDQTVGLSNPNRGRGGDNGTISGFGQTGLFKPIEWPARRSDGKRPGPYPEDCFYAEDMQKGNQAAILVLNLRNAVATCLGATVAPSSGDNGQVILRFDPNWANIGINTGPGAPVTVSNAARMFRVQKPDGTWSIPDPSDAYWGQFFTGTCNVYTYPDIFAKLVNGFLKAPMHPKWFGGDMTTGIAWNWQRSFVGDDLYNDQCGCTTCSTENCTPGRGEYAVGSLSVRFPLGFGSRGGSVGALRLYAESPSLALATPAALALRLRGYDFNSTNATNDGAVASEAYGLFAEVGGVQVLRQIYLPQGLVDIVPETGAPSFGYTMYFYDTQHRGALSGGFFTPNSADAYKTIQVENPDRSASTFNRLRLTETNGGSSTVRLYVYNAASNSWSLTEGTGTDARTVSVSVSWLVGSGSAIGDIRQEIHTVTDSTGVVASKVRRKFKIFYFNGSNGTSTGVPFTQRNRRWELIEETLDPDTGGKQLTTSYRYDETSSFNQVSDARRLKQITRADGSWTHFDYDTQARIVAEYSSFNDSTAPTSVTAAPTGDYRLVETAFNPSGAPAANSVTQETRTEKIRLDGTDYVVGRTFRSVDETNPAYTLITAETATDVSAVAGAASNLVRVTKIWKSGANAGLVERVVAPDGTIQLYSYSAPLPGTNRMVTVREGVPVGGAPLTATDVSDGTITATETNPQGQPVSEVVTDVASGIQLVNTVYADFDTFGRWRLATYNDGTTASRVYNCCGLESEIDRTGMKTVFGYDSLHRQNRRTVYPGAVTTAHSDTENVLDAAGRTLRTIVHACGTSLDATLPASITTRDNTYNAAGQLTGVVTPLGSTQIDETITAAGKRQMTTTYADGGTRIELFNRAGELESISGTAVAPMKYVYGVDAAGAFTQEIRVGESSAETEWTKSYRDFAGRAADTVFADNAKVVHTYYAADNTVAGRRGKLASETLPPDSDTTGAIGVRRLFDYNAEGEQSVVAVDLNQDGVIDYAGKDRIAKTVVDVASITHDSVAYNVRRTTTSVWATDDTDTSTAVSVSETTADGLRSWLSAHGLTTSTLVAFGANAARTVTTTAPDSTVATQSFVGERLQSATTTSGTTQLSGATFLYDAYGRLERATDARNGSTTYTYYADSAQKTVTTPDPDTAKSGDGYDAQTTQFTYDSMGRLTRTVLPDGAESYAGYWPTGALKRTWGARTTPQELTYDPQGRLKTLATWRDFVDETSFATTAGKAVTTWNYNPARGWLDSKYYADGRGPSYEYFPSGALKRRTWARTVNGAVLTTDYTYTKAGALAGIDYSDSTPDVTGIVYDRLGRRTGITDEAGALTTTYEGLTPFADDESYAAGSGVLAGLAVNRGRDTKLRPSSLEVPAAVSVGYTYRDGSRLDSVSATVAGITKDHTYTYQTNSALIDKLVQKRSGATVITTTKVFDKLNRFTSNTAVSAGATNVAGYLYNSANQRTRLTEADGRYWAFGYDALGQVTGGTKKLPDGTAMLGHAFGYTFDTLGNFKTTSVNGQSATYTPNDLNQYTERTVPAFLDVLGTTADAKAKVAANLAPAQRQGALFYKQLSTDNTAVSKWQPIDVLAGEVGAGTGGADAITRQSGHLFLAKTPEEFGYDFDGNLTSDGQWDYSWDAENRLVQMETISAAVASGVPKQRLEFAYDAAGRRIQKKVSTWNGSVYVFASDTRFLYDGWNLLAELNGLNGLAVVRSYVWGLDLSGSAQEAGGVGGLLAVNAGSATYLPVYDGGGNVVSLVDATSGTSVADYEYGPFGEPLRVSGPAAAANPFRFSTKYTDAETGLVYYGYRFLAPSQRRWLNRDRIEEQGGLNLHCMAGNDPVNNADVLGLKVVVLDFMAPPDETPPGEATAAFWAATGFEDISANRFAVSFKELDQMLSDLRYVSDAAFDSAKSAERSRVMLDGTPFTGTKAEYIQIIEHEKQSLYIQARNPGLASARAKIDELARLVTEPTDELGVFYHGVFDTEQMRPNGNVFFGGSDVPSVFADAAIASAKAKLRGNVVRTSCFIGWQPGMAPANFKQQERVIPARGSVGLYYGPIRIAAAAPASGSGITKDKANSCLIQFDRARIERKTLHGEYERGAKIYEK